MSEIQNLYKRISLEFMHAFPGQVYLRFEPLSKAPAIMIQVLPGDIVAISELGDPYRTDSPVDPLDELDSSGVTEEYANPNDELTDDYFRPGDSELKVVDHVRKI